MIKLGDKAKGFEFPSFRNSASLKYNKQMDRYVGVEGVVIIVDADKFSILYKHDHCLYPVQEYLAIQREERLKELGI